MQGGGIGAALFKAGHGAELSDGAPRRLRAAAKVPDTRLPGREAHTEGEVQGGLIPGGRTVETSLASRASSSVSCAGVSASDGVRVTIPSCVGGHRSSSHHSLPRPAGLAPPGVSASLYSLSAR